MRLFIENQTLLYINLLSLFFLTSLIYIFKFKLKKTWIYQILSLFFLGLTFCNIYYISSSKNSKNAFLIDISNSMPNEDVYSHIKTFYTKNDDIYLFAKNTTSYPININDLKNYDELKDSWKNLNLNKTYIKSAILNIENKDKYNNIFIYTDGYETKNSLKNYLLTSNFTEKIFPITPKFLKTSDDLKEITTLVNYAPKGTLNKKSKLRIILKNNKNSDKKISLKISDSNNLNLNEDITISSNNFFSKDYYTNNLLKPLNKISIELYNIDNSLIEKKIIYISASKKDDILLISNSFQDAAYIEKIIKKLGYNLNSIYEIENNFSDNLDKYSLIILNNFPYKKLGLDNSKKIASFVKKGGKFLMLGGENSFGFGKFKSTPIEEISPVTFNEPKKEVKRANFAVALILDNSLSMSKGQKIEYLKLASEKLIKNLNDEDYLGIIGFSSTSFTVFPINNIKDFRQIATNSLNKLSPMGGTNLMPAINDAIQMLSKVKTGKKHIIILSDGQIPGRIKSFLDVATLTRMIGSTLSTIMLGETSYDKILKEMARLGNGNYFIAKNENELPNIFIDDLKIIKGSKDLKEKIFKVEPNNLKSTNLNTFPTLNGVINTTAKEDSITELYAVDFIDKIPLLVSKDIEKGKSIAFTSDMNGRWSKNWIEWEDIYVFWEELLNNTLQDFSKNTSNILDYDISYYIKNGNLFFDINIFKNISSNDLKFELQINGDKNDLDLKKIANGHYIAKYENIITGKYKAYMKFKEKKSLPIIFFLKENETNEQKHNIANLNLLSQLASKHSGKINPSVEDIKSNKSIHSKKDLSLLFIVSSLISLLYSIYLREK